MLFCHPASFTPVCTTEFIELARRNRDFDALCVELLGLSVDSIYSHINWLRQSAHIGQLMTQYPDDPRQ